MKILTLLSIVAFILMMGCTTDQSDEIAQLKQEIEDLKVLAGPPPSSLDSLYPPTADAPVLLFKMFGMNMSLTGIAIDIFEEDYEHAVVNFEKFKTEYAEASKLVPEWEEFYPLDSVEELGKALQTGEQGKVMEAIDKVGEFCHNCHVLNMTKVHQKYHWGDFSELIVTDPLTKQDMDFRQFKQFLNGSIVGVLVDIEQGQKENALNHFEALNERFQELRESCYTCHEKERSNFVDQEVQVLLDELGATLRSGTSDPKQVVELIQGIGMESCVKCHLVHVPAVYSNVRWDLKFQFTDH
jgi:cytochrome c556